MRRLSITKLRGLAYQSGLVEFQINVHGLEVFPRIPLKKGMAPEALGAAAGQLLGGTAVTEARLSSIVDAIILLNYVERADRVEKLMSVLKVRGTAHDPGIYRFEITGQGIEIGEKQQ